MARISDDDLKNSVHKPLDKQSNEIQDEDQRDVVAYSFLLEETDEDSPYAYAKRVKINDKVVYYAKQDKYGRLYNPNGMYSERNQAKELRHAGRPNWVFRDVNRKVFDYYIKFLETKKEAWLHNAERELV